MIIAKNIVMVLHILASLILIVVVLMQSGKSAGLSGTISGGAETFFGKNKGKTLDAILRKWTAFFAILFLATSIALSVIVMTLTAPAETETSITDAQMNELMQMVTPETDVTEAPADDTAETPADDAAEAPAETPAE